jgi:uncharacterized membrane protein YGL010W
MTSLLRDTTTLLANYAGYHRDPRNIATHFVGIPLIVFAVGALLSHPVLATWAAPWGPFELTPAWLLWAAVSLWGLTRGLLALGLAVAAANGLLVGLAALVSTASAQAALAWGLGSFIIGWIFQFIGHYYEGRKPAFVDDLVGLLVGPMFVVAEALFALGLLGPLRQEIERRAGPTRLRDLAAPAAR